MGVAGRRAAEQCDELAVFGVDNEELREKAKELVGLAPDVVWAIATPSVMALRRVTRTVPIVFVAVTDPVGLGIVQNLARPGGSATGFLSAEFGFGAKLLELLKEIAPGVRRVIILTDLDNPSAAPQFAAIQTVAPSIGVELKLLETNDSGLIERGISNFARAGNVGGRCLLLALSGHLFLHRTCPLSGVKQTSLPHRKMSANDPKADIERAHSHPLQASNFSRYDIWI